MIFDLTLTFRQHSLYVRMSPRLPVYFLLRRDLIFEENCGNKK